MNRLEILLYFLFFTCLNFYIINADTIEYSFVGITPLGDTFAVTGDEICWINNDIFHHTATNLPDSEEIFDSGSMFTGDRWCHTFQNIGSFPYFCEIHPEVMRGNVIIVSNREDIPPNANLPLLSISNNVDQNYYISTKTSNIDYDGFLSTKSSNYFTYSDVFDFSKAVKLSLNNIFIYSLFIFYSLYYII
eukprot:TRINITY_DN4525_c0_g2_i1.p1 TRINITY_DN4525_c0_g2~~TRINITY_DN4525_c0_g2_i1.p1  ORF type:complete len:191 (-),score=23.73 TRINITY_DN4525_c0_g2_i1:142-714(-)